MGLDYLKGTTNFGQAQDSEQLETNIIAYLDWGFLTIGGFTNVYVPQSGQFGGNQSRLRPAADPNYTNGQVWECFRQNLVWESGVNLQAGGSQPIQISGVYVNNVFQPASGIGVYRHWVDYPRGRVVFASPISTTSNVQLSYSYKNVAIKSSDTDEFRDLMFNSFRNDNVTFLQLASGNWAQNPANRVQLPAVFVEVLSNKNYDGWQLGGGQRVTYTTAFHIFAEDTSIRKRIADVIGNQNRITFFMFDRNLMAAQNAFPITASGTKSGNPKTYPQLIQPSGDGGFLYERAFILDSNVRNVTSVLPLSRATVTWNIELLLSTL